MMPSCSSESWSSRSRQHHPVGGLAAQLGAPQRLRGPGQARAGQRDHDHVARVEVGGAADDLAGLGLPHVDAAQAQPVGVRVLAPLDDAPEAERAEVVALVGRAAALEALQLEPGDAEALGDLLRRGAHVDQLPQPGDGHLHEGYCSSSRRSLS